MPRKVAKKLETDDVINQATKVLIDIMNDANAPAVVRVSAASKVLAIYSKDRDFESGKETKQLSLDFTMAVRKNIYGLE